MDDKIVFKTATVGGFEKKAVLDYIAQMSEEHEHAQRVLLEQIAGLEDQLEETAAKQQEAKAMASSLERELTASEERSSSKLDIQERLNDTTDQMAQEIEALKKSLLLTQQENDSLTLRYQDLDERKEEIDRTSAQLGKIMLDARADSNALVSNAEEQARDIEMKAHIETEKRRELAKKEADEVALAAKTQAEEVATTATKEAKTIVDSADRQARSMVADAEQGAVKIIGDANDLADATLHTLQQDADALLASNQTRISALLSLGDVTSRSANTHLDSLRKESDQIQDALKQSIAQLEKESSALQEVIAGAEATVATLNTPDDILATLDIPELSAKDVAIIKASMEEASLKEASAETDETPVENIPSTEEIPAEPPETAEEHLGFLTEEPDTSSRELYDSSDDFFSPEDTTEEEEIAITLHPRDEPYLSPIPPALSGISADGSFEGPHDSFFLQVDDEDE